MKVFINISWIAGLLALSFIYLLFVADHVPQKYALVINIITIPLILGVLGAWAIDAPLYVRLFALLTIPVAHVLYFGGDPAKPGMENLVAMAEGVALWVGAILFYLSDKFIFK